MVERGPFIDTLHQRIFNWLERDTDGQSGWKRIDGGRVAIATDVGTTRDENQDRVAVVRSTGPNGVDYLLLLVCDGMGGMLDGGKCASGAASGFIIAFLKASHAPLRDRLVSAAHVTNAALHSVYNRKGGSTLSAICLSSAGERFGVNVGDSRIYASKGNILSQLTVDDSLAGHINIDEREPEARSLLQFIGMGADIDPHVIEAPLGTHRLILATDGVHFTPYETLGLLARHATSGVEVVRRMVQVAQWAGCRDNGTAACVDIEDPLMPPNPVERSVRIWDPWGELHILNPTDGRPNEKRDLSVGGPNDLQSFEAPRRDFAAPKDKVELRQRRRKGGSNKSGMPRDSPRSNMKREDAKIEITDIIDPTAEGED